MTSVEKLIQPHLLTLKPYSSARHEFTGTANIFLDANENPYQTGRNRYPDPFQNEVKKKIAKWRGVATDQIFLGNGSDEAIDLIIRLFCRPGKDEILIPDPTYGMYAVSAQIHNISVNKIPLQKDFELDVEAIFKTIQPNSKILFICSPNNPTGNCMLLDDMVSLIEQFPGIVVIDEAYIDFCPEETMMKYVKQFSNLIILQTFSKAWGLAGIRLGMAFGSSEIISWINKIKPPYNINILTQQAILDAFDNQKQMKKWVENMLQQKAWLTDELAQIPFVKTVYPSKANFILAEMDDAKNRYKELVTKGIVVRDRSNVLLCDECLRFSIGTATENKALINAMNS